MAASIHPSAKSRCWALAPLLLAMQAVYVPYFLSHNWISLGVALHQAFALVCHQRPERSFWVFGAPMAVCARCLGIYIGAALGLFVRTSRRLALRLLLVAGSLSLLDGVAEVTGLHGGWSLLRFALGLALGASATMVIGAAIQHDDHASSRLAGTQVAHRLESTN